MTRLYRAMVRWLRALGLGFVGLFGGLPSPPEEQRSEQVRPQRERAVWPSNNRALLEKALKACTTTTVEEMRSRRWRGGHYDDDDVESVGELTERDGTL